MTDDPAAHQLFSKYYYHQGGFSGDYARTAESLGYYGAMAQRIKQDVNPGSVLDAGCAIGLLVETLRDRGVQAYGVDISEYAISQVPAALRPYCRVASLLQPLPPDWPPRFDLVTCIEVLEHLPLEQAEAAISNLCQVTDDILFSSTPGHFGEATHFNVQPVDFWIERFALHGFTHDLEFDAGFIADWAVRLRRSPDAAPRVIRHYEQQLQRTRQEARSLRQALLEQRDHLARQEAMLDSLRESVLSQTDNLVYDITGSQAWRVAIRLWQLRQAVAPNGSRRARLLRPLASILRAIWPRPKPS
jgi:SAM-dependent methyltransferase